MRTPAGHRRGQGNARYVPILALVSILAACVPREGPALTTDGREAPAGAPPGASASPEGFEAAGTLGSAVPATVVAARPGVPPGTPGPQVRQGRPSLDSTLAAPALALGRTECTFSVQ